MRIVLRVLPVILLLAVALTINVSASAAANFDIKHPIIGLNPAQVGDNVTSTVTEGTSFWAIFPPWVWWTIGGIILVLFIMIIVLVAVPSSKKKGAKGAQGMQGMQGMQEGMPIPTPMSGPGSFNQPVGTTMPPQAPGVFPMQ